VVHEKYTIWSPTQQLKQYHNFSAIGLNAGLTYFLGKKKNEKPQQN
jgi:hypothetical protein